jgi:hypothetical protein
MCGGLDGIMRTATSASLVATSELLIILSTLQQSMAGQGDLFC